MPIFEFEVDYSQRQVCHAFGIISGEVEASSKEEAIDIIKATPHLFSHDEMDLEIVDADDPIYNWKTATFTGVDTDKLEEIDRQIKELEMKRRRIKDGLQ